MTIPANTLDQLAAENAQLRQRLAEASEALDAIRRGDVNAVVVECPEGPRVYMLAGVDEPYRVMVEEMQEGAVTLREDGLILYSNQQIARLLRTSPHVLLAAPFGRFLAPSSVPVFEALLHSSRDETNRGEVTLAAADGTLVPVYLTISLLHSDGPANTSVVITDLTQQKRYQEIVTAEAASNSILDQALDAVVVCDPAGRVIRANQTAHRLCGSNPLLRPFHAAFSLHRQIEPRTGESITVGFVPSSPHTPCAEIGTRSVPSTILAILIDAPILRHNLHTRIIRRESLPYLATIVRVV